MIAITMPGNTGDMLYALPTARLLCAGFNTTCDFYTAKTSLHTKRLLEYQSYIDAMIIPESYVIERRDIGTQPWLMPVPSENYDAVYHLGYRAVPDRALHQFIAHQIGIDIPLAVSYESPDIDLPTNKPYICLSPRGKTSYEGLFYDVSQAITEQGIEVVQIGGTGENIGAGINMTGIDMLETVSLLKGAKGFFGMMSSQLVLANGFQYPKVSPHDGIHWDMRHVVRTASNHYPINPSVKDVLKLLDIL